jgi:hypothetical protein
MAQDPGLGNLLYDPFILPCRRDLRFPKLCKEMNVPVPKNWQTNYPPLEGRSKNAMHFSGRGDLSATRKSRGAR